MIRFVRLSAQKLKHYASNMKPHPPRQARLLQRTTKLIAMLGLLLISAGCGERKPTATSSLSFNTQPPSTGITELDAALKDVAADMVRFDHKSLPQLSRLIIGLKLDRGFPRDVSGNLTADGRQLHDELRKQLEQAITIDKTDLPDGNHMVTFTVRMENPFEAVLVADYLAIMGMREYRGAADDVLLNRKKELELKVNELRTAVSQLESDKLRAMVNTTATDLATFTKETEAIQKQLDEAADLLMKTDSRLRDIMMLLTASVSDGSRARLGITIIHATLIDVP